MEEHQKRPGGNPKIVSYLAKYFRYPKDLDSLAYVSQLSQSDAIRFGVEHWRRNRGRCMGSLYWQLNDNWPVASWSSLDYYGRWKALHYTVKRAYDNLLLSLEGENENIGIHLSNESLEAVTGQGKIVLYNLKGEVLFSKQINREIRSMSSQCIYEFSLSSLDEAPSESCLILAAYFTSSQGKKYQGYHNFAPYKHLELVDPEISLSFDESEDGGETIILESKAPALFVELSFKEKDRVFSDNYFPLFPGQKKRVTIKKTDKSDFSKKSIQVRSLYDSYTN